MTLYHLLSSWENVWLAYQKACRSKRKNPGVAAFEHKLEENLWQLHLDLRQKIYKPAGYHSFFIHDPKKRLISAAPFRDRVVHHALCQLTQPTFERSFIFHSFANRPGKGTHRARQQCQTFARKFPFVLQCDLREFFPSIDHAILKSRIAAKIDDEQVIELVHLILQSGEQVLKEQYTMVYFPGDDLLASLRPRGLPIGNLTSQLWANVYLNPFDHFVKRQLRCPAYCRYVDDFLLFAHSKKQLWQWKTEIERFLATLRLTMHPGSQPRPVTEGIPFLGFQIFPEKMRLKPRNSYNYRRKLQKMKQQYREGKISLDAMTASVRGWANHSRYGNTVGLRKAILTNTLILPPQHNLRED